jgi:hypothetical protein
VKHRQKYAGILLRKLLEIKRAIDIEDLPMVRLRLIDAQDYLFQIQEASTGYSFSPQQSIRRASQAFRAAGA